MNCSPTRARIPTTPALAEATGGPNEVWSYGEEAYGILRDHLSLRERLRPYLTRLSEDAHRTGAPPMRPLFFDFPDDGHAWDIDDHCEAMRSARPPPGRRTAPLPTEPDRLLRAAGGQEGDS
ncbi:hypothetical protein ADL01_11105 [Streptomyces sp. NRRL WC-3618]|uniref:TIM-barrel domain-containing protein n=1 Tax=Streptomyces sp. NRRL WC-3618 TaxID=1519490 RepID=UPI0006AFBB97|nr:hypothetical protein ADL01_11105 [Streptomyces sp. NRRL WC-3618]